MRAIVYILILWAGAVVAQNKSLGTAKLPTGTEKRAAVIFANQDYTDLRYDLQKTYNDADDMKATLESMGFEVIVFKKDLKEREFAREIQALNSKLRGYQVVFFYYSGHGAEYQGENYLIPTDIDIESDADIESQGIKLSHVYDALVEAGVKTSILALDACRSRPMGKGSLPHGLIIPANNPAGTFTMYATRAGNIARENRIGRNSYFTQELLKYLPQPDVTLDDIFYNVRQGVKKATSNEQDPNISNELDGKFVFLQTNKTDPPLSEASGNRNTRPVSTPASPVKKPEVSGNEPMRPSKFLDLPFADMAYVKGGSFEMGDVFGEGESDERPVRKVTVKSFVMSKYEITQRQWEDVMGVNPSYFEDCPNCPVEQVSWGDVQLFLTKLNARTGGSYRLPTEAEWEYAAREGGRKVRYGNGKDILSLDEANAGINNKEYTIDVRGKTLQVGSFNPNALGLYDMTGNVWEWCQDWYDTYSINGKDNPTGVSKATYRVQRGGSWGIEPQDNRATHRGFRLPPEKSPFVGFRIVSSK